MKNLITCILISLLFVAGLSHAGEAGIKKRVEAWLGNDAKVDVIRKSGVPGLYEIQAGDKLFYTDAEVSHVIIGKIIDVKAGKDLTQERRQQLSAIKFSDLPLELAVKQVRGNGKRVFATFEDPNCGYCRKLAKEMAGLTDVTIYTFLYPILAPDSFDKSKAIWCSEDRARSWIGWMLDGTSPVENACDSSVIDKVVALGQKLKISGTPTIFMANGERITGAIPVAQLEKSLGAAN